MSERIESVERRHGSAVHPDSDEPRIFPGSPVPAVPVEVESGDAAEPETTPEGSSGSRQPDGQTPAAETGAQPGTAEIAVVPPVSDDDRPCFRLYLRPWRFADEPECRPRPAGVWWHDRRVVNRRSGATEPVDVRICGPLWVPALSHDEARESFGMVLAFIDLDGNRRQVVLSRALLAGERGELARVLLRLGLDLDPRQSARLPDYLSRMRPERRVLATSRAGWLPGFGSFVLPDRIIGGNGEVVWEGDPSGLEANGLRRAPVGGEFAAWRERIAALAMDNALVAFAIELALAGPLFRIVGKRAAGAHYHGPSSTGKTSLLRAAASVWGPGEPGFVRTWNGTRNGLEAVAAAANDTVLCLDEIGEIAA